MFIGTNNICYTGSVKIGRHNEWNLQGQHIFCAEAEFHQIISAEENAKRRPSEQPKIHHVQETEHLIPLFHGFAGIVIADTGSQAIEHLRQQRVERID